jgi:ADP-dependent NAD(P)H-hydrate dehydratase / NAD(P)H-hydrate epimerase
MSGILPVFSGEQVRAAEERAFAITAPGELMQRASFALGVGCAQALEDMYGRVYGTTATVVVGPGNNGGDALYAGAYLSRRGVKVTAHCVVQGAFHTEAMSAFLASGGTVADCIGLDVDLVIDGIAGLGSGRPVDSSLAQWINNQAFVVSVDIPSGVNADTGECSIDASVHADLTFTFGALKPGLVLSPGSELAGEVEIVDIGVEWNETPSLHVMLPEGAEEFFHEPQPDAYKYSRGVVGIAAGSSAYPGAIQLVVLGAQHTGVGMVMCATVGDFDAHITDEFPHVVMTSANSSRVSAWGVGPGFSGTDAESEFLTEILSGSLPVVLDAGALTALAQSVQLRALVEKRSALTVITPHVGEFRKLFPDRGEPTWSNVRHAAQNLNAIVVAKGPRTIMCAPDGRSFVDIEGTSALATAGSGDILTGNIAGLLAAHSSRLATQSLEIVAAGVWMHGRAGRIAAEFTLSPTAVDIGDACAEVVPL